MTRPRVAFLAWTQVGGRAAEISEALGGESEVIFDDRLTRRALVPVRYFLSTFATIAYLVRRRPRAVIATLPPVFPGILGYLYARAFGVPFLLDSHPAGFGKKSNRVSQVLLPIHRWLSRRAAATMVTTTEWIEVVDQWGGKGVVIHEAPPAWSVERAETAPREPLRVLFVAVFSPDEPVWEVVEAARSLPEVSFTVTGRVEKAPDGLIESAPENVHFCGFLDPEEYRRAVEQTDIVLALTTEPTSVMRAAYEAVYAHRPLVATDHDENRRLFPHAVLVDNDAAGIVKGVNEASDRFAALVESAPAAHESQRERWQRQLEELERAIGVRGGTT